jgi:hypothetical protein
MILRLRGNLKRLRRLRLATVLTLSVALLALPCAPFAEVLGSNTGHAVAAAAPAHAGYSHADRAHDAGEPESSCCTDCSTWLAALIDDGGAAIIAHNWSRSDLSPVALAHAPLVTDKSARDYRFTGPPSAAFVDGTSLYAKTQRYRI